MKTVYLFILVLILITNHSLTAQNANTEITSENYIVFNREVSYEDGVAHLNAQAGDGLLWLNSADFKNGVIGLDIKGENTPGRSFVELAFHGQDDQIFDAVYFRPFNFINPEKKDHAVQYVSVPKNDWSALQKAFPGKYESTIQPTPEPVDDWFHAEIVMNYPQVKVYVNGSDQPTLEVEQISDTKQGRVDFWVGNGSEGWFKNLEITSDP